METVIWEQLLKKKYAYSEASVLHAVLDSLLLPCLLLPEYLAINLGYTWEGNAFWKVTRLVGLWKWSTPNCFILCSQHLWKATGSKRKFIFFPKIKYLPGTLVLMHCTNFFYPYSSPLTWTVNILWIVEHKSQLVMDSWNDIQ